MKLLETVFGLTREIPDTYTKRANVDDRFKDSLCKKSHIIIYGCSKQGKTCLRKLHLHDHECLIIQCDNKTTLIDIHKKILKEAGFKQIIKESSGSKNSIASKASLSANLFTFIKAKGEVELGKDRSKEIEEKPFEFDLSNSNDVIDALKTNQFDKYVLIEDFHYLKMEVQEEIAFILKAYYDNSKIVFIIIGVWKEENKITNLNRDLIGRTVSINADSWTDDDLKELIETGTELLNIRFDDELIERILDNCFGSVYFVQELCFALCKHFKIIKTIVTDGPKIRKHVRDNDGRVTERYDDGRFLINDDKTVFQQILLNILSQHSSHYKSLFLEFEEDCTDDKIAKLILSLIIQSEPSSLMEGIYINALKEFIKNNSLNPKLSESATLFRSLKGLSSLQLRKGIVPNILDFDDSHSKINIIDKTFLIWLHHCDKIEMESMLT